MSIRVVTHVRIRVVWLYAVTVCGVDHVSRKCPNWPDPRDRRQSTNHTTPHYHFIIGRWWWRSPKPLLYYIDQFGKKLVLQVYLRIWCQCSKYTLGRGMFFIIQSTREITCQLKNVTETRHCHILSKLPSHGICSKGGYCNINKLCVIHS